MKKDMMLVINDNLPTEEEMREFEESIPKEERDAILKDWYDWLEERNKKRQQQKQ